MRGLSPFGGDTDDSFDDIAEFVPENLPDPGPFLEDHDVLDGDDHVAVHRMTESVFEQRGVYDVTFGYNLAKLNLDTRHPEAGYRYAVERDPTAHLPIPAEKPCLPEAPTVLRAEFTPTTEFCPQGDTLTKGSFRAWNGLSDHHEYDLVRVRVSHTHNQSVGVNAVLEELERAFLRGELDSEPEPEDDDATEDAIAGAASNDTNRRSTDGSSAPF